MKLRPEVSLFLGSAKQMRTIPSNKHVCTFCIQSYVTCLGSLKNLADQSCQPSGRYLTLVDINLGLLRTTSLKNYEN